MKFQCTCGHIVRDDGRSNHIKGHILREQSFDAAYKQPSATITEFTHAVSAGRRKEWIDRFYGQPRSDLPDSSVVFDIITYARLRTALDIYQCEACGRLYLQRQPSSGTMRIFKPEDLDWKGTLSDNAAA